MIFVKTVSLCTNLLVASAKSFILARLAALFFQRFEEHKRSLQRKDKTSALSEHAETDHSDISDLNIDQFHVHLVAKFSSPVEAKISEARLIGTLRPQLNRKVEKAHW